MFQQVESVFQGIRDDDIEYVLTVPAIFGENSKMFLREASINVRMFKSSFVLYATKYLCL